VISRRLSRVGAVTSGLLGLALGTPFLSLPLFSVPFFAGGCAGEPPRRPNIMHPVEERRAVEILSRVFGDAGLDVDHYRDVTVGERTLRIDVAAAGHKYGIAYLSHEAQIRLDDGISKHDPDSEALVVVDAKEGDRVLVLYERDYMTDDLEGEAHSATTIAAENKIERDARDFVIKAVREKWR
jgi:hypothetical protein